MRCATSVPAHASEAVMQLRGKASPADHTTETATLTQGAHPSCVSDEDLLPLETKETCESSIFITTFIRRPIWTHCARVRAQWKSPWIKTATRAFITRAITISRCRDIAT